jgi:hypothetical protein
MSTDGASTSGAAGEPGEVECEGAHPNVNGQARTCDPGSCYCAGEPIDTGFAADRVEACCDGAIRCGSDSEEPGVDCSGEHPLVTDEARTCEPGNCLCSDGETVDKCLPREVARVCCPAELELSCVPAE